MSWLTIALRLPPSLAPSLPPPPGRPLCAVCVSVLNQVNELLAPEDRKNQAKIEAAIDTFCAGRLSARDDKMVRE